MTDEPLAQAMHETSGDFPPEIGEPDYLGLKLAPSSKVSVPRLADAPWAMECKIWKTIDMKGNRLLIMGEGINFHIRDELWDPAAMRVHMERYHPVGRMFADRYCRTDDRMVFPTAEGVKAKIVGRVRRSRNPPFAMTADYASLIRPTSFDHLRQLRPHPLRSASQNRPPAAAGTDAASDTRGCRRDRAASDNPGM